MSLSLFSGIRERWNATAYLWRTRLVALYSLATMSKREIEAYYYSYVLFERDGWSNNDERESHVVNYYLVLNHLCALGSVEKMYIPPLLNENVGIMDNQILYERKMMADIGLFEGDNSDKRVLDVGCGRGCIALHVARATGAFVSGIDIEPSHVANARTHARRIGLADQTQFRVASFNEHPLPFSDESFDAIYDVQAFTYAMDKKGLFGELFRVLKPGGKLTLLEWVLKDAFSPANPEHADHVAKTMPFIGAVDAPHYAVFEKAATDAGFQLLLSDDISLNGHQAPLIQAERRHYAWVRTFARLVLPRRFSELLERLKLYAQHFVDADELGLATTSFQILCQKPAFNGEPDLLLEPK